MMRIIRQLLNFVLPTSCSYCQSPIGDSVIPLFCSSCWSDFTPIHGPACPSCGRPFESPEVLSHSPGHVCLACRRVPPAFDQALSVGYFEGSLREAIHQFKYRPCRSLGRPLGEWMATKVRLVSDIDIILPVPLHSKRLKERGFNQALLLAYQMSETYHIPLSCDNLYRVRRTRPQVELTGEERIKNVAGAFALRRPGDITDRRVIIVDDVFTTGATMNECAAVLKKSGAARVTALTLARAM
jgi:ComF family protein